jgi:hypothetical protein
MLSDSSRTSTHLQRLLRHYHTPVASPLSHRHLHPERVLQTREDGGGENITPPYFADDMSDTLDEILVVGRRRCRELRGCPVRVIM